MTAERPLARLSRRYHLSASHRLHTEAYDEERNREVFGKCNNPHGHGHNYTVEVTFSGAIDRATGMVTNLADLDQFSEGALMEVFDGKNLNTLPCFSLLVPTTENFAVEIFRIFSSYPHARLERVHIDETPNNSFEYAGADAAGLGERGK